MKWISGIFFGILITSIVSKAEVRPRVIYGDDNRKEVYQVSDAMLREVSDSTVALIPESQLSKNKLGGIDIGGSTYGVSFGLCKDEPYYSQPSSAMCSGFLVGEDLIATAGHCMSDGKCNDLNFVFGFRMANDGSSPQSVGLDDVYKCQKVLAYEQTGNQDYALVKLDRPVKGYAPLKLQNAPVQSKDAVTVIGHPSGIPTKVADGGYVRAVMPSYFITNLDTYGGNSGSAVFNSTTKEVVGVLVRGATDFVYDTKKQCSRSNVCKNDGCRGEDVTLISYIQKAIVKQNH